MSLATTSAALPGAGGAGGVAMAHGAVGRTVVQPKTHAKTHATSSGHGTAAPPLMGADVSDKQQGLSLKQVRNIAHLPLVAVDLFAPEPTVAMFPPKSKDAAAAAALSPMLMGRMKAKVALAATEASHKTLRKWLAKQKPFTALQSDSLVHNKDDKDEVVVLDHPQMWMGLRRLNQAPDFVRSQAPTQEDDESNTPAIAEETLTEPGVIYVNSTLDGSSTPTGDDFDRVVCQVRLHAKKKVLTLLPEEATQILLRQAQNHVVHKYKGSPLILSEDEEEEVEEYPLAVAVPAFFSHDAAVEALLDATGSTGVVYQRSVCALAGALLTGADQGQSNEVLQQLARLQALRREEHQVQKRENPDAVLDDSVLLLLMGMTSFGLECTAVQVSSPQNSQASCLYGSFNVLCNVSYQAEEPLSLMTKCLAEMSQALSLILGEEDDGPALLVLYGSSGEQKKMEHGWNEIVKNDDSTVPSVWSKRPVLRTKPDAVVMGTAVLGAVSHGRLAISVSGEGSKPKMQLGIRVQNVAPVAVGVRISYQGGDKQWEPVKTIFDFDRRVPAGPYVIDLKASECVVYRTEKNASSLPEEDFLKATKAAEGSKGIPQREQAALNLRVQMVQKWTRDGDWVNVGDVMEPLVMKGGDDGETPIACEEIALEVSLGVTGMITANLVGERESVVQATKSARNSTLRFWIGILAAILFFGGFLVKSYWEDYVFERDTQRLLAYYKHVLPGSVHDGDVDSARYLVYKYRGKAAKLWKALERKYDAPVREAHEWEDYEHEGSSSGDDKVEEETADLDEEENDQSEAPREDEPDL